MPHIKPVPESVAADKVEQTYGRLHELFETSDPLPEPFLLYGRVPAFLQDFYMNFKKFCYASGSLDTKVKSLIALAVAGNFQCEPWAEFFANRAMSLGADEQTLADVAGVASTCAMYNTFFKFRDLSGSDLFSGMPAGLRAHTFGGTSLDEQTVELINIAISDLNGCKPCTEGHVASARKLGLSDAQILETIQCAATLFAGIQFLKHAGTDGRE
jgi:alkyl hydroperoxide reductase subunit D